MSGRVVQPGLDVLGELIVASRASSTEALCRWPMVRVFFPFFQFSPGNVYKRVMGMFIGFLHS